MRTATTAAIGTRSRVRRSQKATLGNPRDEQWGLYRVPKLAEMEEAGKSRNKCEVPQTKWQSHSPTKGSVLFLFAELRDMAGIWLRLAT
jgi:hypothetical protein